MIHEDAFVRADGKVSERRGELYLSNPKNRNDCKTSGRVGDSLFGGDDEAHSLYPVYPESKGVTSNWIYHTIQKIFSAGILDNIKDPIPEYILNTYNLPSLKTALYGFTPAKERHAISARKKIRF